MSGQLPWGDLVVAGDARRREVRERQSNGVDGVEVREGGRRLLVYFLEHAPHHLHHGNIRIDAPPGGRPVRAVEVTRAAAVDSELEDRVIVELDRPGSAGSYRLRIVERAADGLPSSRTLRGIDPRFADARFVFDVDAPQPPIAGAPAGGPAADHEVSYVLRDYEGLRQLMLDRLRVTIPGWTERHVPDVWITLVELLAYVGDDLSYYQDAVATEAYLQTARRRISVRRHARLVGYRLHDGCNARSWVAVEVTAPVSLPVDRVRFAAVGALLDARPPVIDAATFSPAKLASLPQYSPMPARLQPAGRDAELTLRPAHNQIPLWSWGELNSHLRAGATSAVLIDGARAEAEDRAPKRALRLAVGDVIILTETHDPRTQGKGPPDPAHRQAVRLTEVRRLTDALYHQPLLEVRWSSEDALGFDLAVMAGGHAVSQATGNVVLVAHGVPATDDVNLAAPRLSRSGLTFSTPFPDPDLVARHQARALRGLYRAWRREVGEWRAAADRGTPLSGSQLDALRRQVGVEPMEQLGLTEPFLGDDDKARAAQAEREAEALEELLAQSDRLLAARRRRLDVLAALTDGSGPLEDVLLAEIEEDWGRELAAGLAPGRAGSWGPASDALAQDPRAALPVLELADATGSHPWQPAADLIGAARDDRTLVAEVNDQGIAELRINDAGRNLTFAASYWVGNGASGNAEAEAINAVVWLPAAATGTAAKQAASPANPPAAIAAVGNPLPATGGVDPESAADAKRGIPGSFLGRQQRALTADDYQSLGAAVPGVRRAAAELRVSGSVMTIDVAIQPSLGEDPHSDLLESVEQALGQARRIGHVLRVIAPRYRPLVVGLDVALAPTALRAEVAGRLAQLLSSGWTAVGTPALFNPQLLGFAATVYASPIIAAVHAVAGIEAVSLTKLGFLGATVRAGAPAAPNALTVGTLELPRLDNDPVAPERGYALVEMEGGR